MSNRFHLFIETSQGNWVAGMKRSLGTFTSRSNRRHQWFGHLFSGPDKALIVDGSGDGFLRTVGEMEQGVGEHPNWDAKRETDEQKSERIVAEELRKRRWAEGTLKERRKTDAEKVKLAQTLCCNRLMSQITPVAQRPNTPWRLS